MAVGGLGERSPQRVGRLLLLENGFSRTIRIRLRLPSRRLCHRERVAVRVELMGELMRMYL